MSTQVIRIEGYSKGSLSCIGNECDRKPGVEHRNSDIDEALSKYNWSFKDTNNGSFYTEYSEIMSQLNVQKPRERKKDIAFEGVLITSDGAFFEGKSDSEVQHFFEVSYKWALEQIGYNGTDKNILSAKVHLDEGTPHMHIYYVPITDKWKEKVYEKDENGHVLRNKNNSPIQAKDEDGKTIYNEVEDKDHPKLSRTDFWRLRGGKSSYRNLQDSFQAIVGKRFGLERGEVGSNRKHETKYQWKEKQLKEQQQAIETELKEYKDMKVDIEQVDKQLNEKRVLLSSRTTVDTEALTKVKEQAKSYCAAKPQIDDIAAQQDKIVMEWEQIEAEKERLAKEKERLADEKAFNERRYKENLDDSKELQAKIEKQQHLNELYDKQRQIAARQQEMLGDLRDRLARANQRTADVVQSLRALSEGAGKQNQYKAQLTAEQRDLIECTVEYAYDKLSVEDEYLAEDMRYDPPQIQLDVKARVNERERERSPQQPQRKKSGLSL